MKINVRCFLTVWLFLKGCGKECASKNFFEIVSLDGGGEMNKASVLTRDVSCIDKSIGLLGIMWL